MIDPGYQQMYRQASDLKYQMHDAIDQPNHPMAHIMRREIDALMDDMETGKQPRSVESRIKMIQNQLTQMRMQGGQVMSYNDVDHFHRTYQQMRNDLRKFHNY